MNSDMRSQSNPSSTPIPFVPWENGSQQNHHYNLIEQREYRRRLAGAVRTLLHRQNRAYHRRIHQLQERWNQQQQQQEQFKMSHLAPTGFMENEDVMRLTVDVPGVSKDDIQVQVVTSPSQHELRITAKRSYMSIDSTSCVSTNTKSQRYCINHNVIDVAQINATLHNGVLTVTAPKKKAIHSSENKIHDMGTSKDNSMHELNLNYVANGKESLANEERKDTNEVINISVSEE